MRWDALFDDLEAQLEAVESAELVVEIADRGRREAGMLRLVDRLGAGVGHPLRCAVVGAGMISGTLLGVGPDWLLVEEAGGREALVSLAALTWATGAGVASSPPGAEGAVGARLDLRYALRRLARDRAELDLVLVEGGLVHATAERVGADFVEVTERHPGEPRQRDRAGVVWTVPLAAVALVRRR